MRHLADPVTPAGWKLTVPAVNVKENAGDRVAVWVAAIADRDDARRAIPYGVAVPSAPLAPLSAAELKRYGVAPGETKRIYGTLRPSGGGHG